MEAWESRTYALALWLALLLLLLEAVATVRYVSELQAVLIAFGAELPALTRFVLQGPTFVWVLPITTALLLTSFYRQKQARWGALLIVIVLGVAWVPTVFVGLYLPIAESAETAVGENAKQSF